MISAKSKFVSALLFSGMVAVASAQTPSNIDFRVSGSPNYPILDSGTGNLLNYDLTNGRIDFSVGSTGAYDKPFFCFDFSDSGSEGVSLNATDANGHVLMDSVGLASDLTYDLAGDAISMAPSSSVQCFFKSVETDTFGPFGKLAKASREADPELPPCSETPEGPCSFFGDDFADYPKLNIQFANLRINNPEAYEGTSLDGASVSPGDLLTYDLIIRNTGAGDAEALAFQELFPAGGNFDAALSEGDWICIDMMETGSCPAANGTDPIRFQDVVLPAGAELVFEINREVALGSEGVINLYAGLINGAGAKVESAVAEVELGIMGEPVAMAFASQPGMTYLGDTIRSDAGDPIVVEIVDANGIRVTDHNSGQIQMELFDSSGYVAVLESYTNVSAGTVEFSDLSTAELGITAGEDYELRAVSTEFSTSVRSDPFEIAAAP